MLIIDDGQYIGAYADESRLISWIVDCQTNVGYQAGSCPAKIG